MLSADPNVDATMKSLFQLVSVIASLAITEAQADQKVQRVKMRDVPTHDEVVENARKALEDAPPPEFKPASGADPSVTNKPESIIARSEILCYRGQATLVPKRSVIHIPKGLSDRLVLQEGARLVTWIDFFHANRAWIRTVQISRIQAEGKKPLDEAILESFEKESRLVVATFQEGPISVLPLKVPKESTTEGTVSTGSDTSAAQTVAKP